MTRSIKAVENLKLLDSGRKMFIDFPKEYVNNLSPEMQKSFGKESSFQSEDLERIGNKMDIKDLNGMIEKHRYTGAKDLIGRRRGFLFNGSMLGISSSKSEGNHLILEMYETDYFSHWVFQSIYQELKEKNHPITNLKSVEEINKYFLFATSFGFNLFIHNEEETLFAKRSQRVANMAKSMYHVSVNEGSEKKDIISGELDIEKWFLRGMKEELGIGEEFFSKNKYERKIYDLFLEEDIFQFAISASVRLETPLEEIVRFQGVDKAFEIENLKIVKNKELSEFIKKEEFTKRSLHCLRFFKEA